MPFRVGLSPFIARQFKAILLFMVSWAFPINGIIMALAATCWLLASNLLPPTATMDGHFASAWSVVLFTVLVLTTLTFIALYCARLRADQPTPVLANKAVETYLLRTAAWVLGLSIALVLHYRGETTPHVLLTYVPPIVSLSAFVNLFSNVNGEGDSVGDLANNAVGGGAV